jgi:hypothetical protein
MNYLNEIFDKFKNENNVVDFINIRQIFNIIKLKLSDIEQKSTYTFDEFMYQINNSSILHDDQFMITRTSFNKELKNTLDKDSVKYITNKIFNKSSSVNINFNLII